MNDQTAEHIHVETFVWMKKIHATNTGKEYYELGRVVDKKNTLAVTLVGGNGGAMFFCEIHNFAYRATDTCDQCRNAVREETSEGV